MGKKILAKVENFWGDQSNNTRNRKQILECKCMAITLILCFVKSLQKQVHCTPVLGETKVLKIIDVIQHSKK